MLKALVLVLAAALAASSASAAKPARSKKKTKAKKSSAPRVTSLHEKFLALDVNADGVIDEGEMHAYENKVVGLTEKGPKKLSEKDADAERAALDAEYKRDDADHDGKISEAEFKAAEKSSR